MIAVQKNLVFAEASSSQLICDIRRSCGSQHRAPTMPCRFLAHRVISLPRGNSVAFGLKRTLGRILWSTRPVSALEKHEQWQNRRRNRAVVEFQIAGRRRQRQAFCHYRQSAAAVVAGHSDRRRGGTARLLCLALVRTLGAEGYAEEDRREVECYAGADAGRSCRAKALRGTRHPDHAAATAIAGSLAGVSEGRDRALVADHPGGQPQGGMKRWLLGRTANR
jgi:hypothetical protein